MVEPQYWERRMSVWSVPAQVGIWFYVAVLVHVVPMIWVLWLAALGSGERDNIAGTGEEMIFGATSAFVLSAILSSIELEFVMVMREWYRIHVSKKIIKERDQAYRKGYEAGVKAALDRDKHSLKAQTEDEGDGGSTEN